MRRLISLVGPENSLDSSSSFVVVVDLDDAVLARLQRIGGMCKELGALSINYFWQLGDWHDCEVIEWHDPSVENDLCDIGDWALLPGDAPLPFKTAEELGEHERRLEMIEAVVFDTEFRVEAYLDETDIRYVSRSVAFNRLDGLQTLVVPPQDE